MAKQSIFFSAVFLLCVVGETMAVRNTGPYGWHYTPYTNFPGYDLDPTNDVVELTNNIYSQELTVTLTQTSTTNYIPVVILPDSNVMPGEPAAMFDWADSRENNTAWPGDYDISTLDIGLFLPAATNTYDSDEADYELRPWFSGRIGSAVTNQRTVISNTWSRMQQVDMPVGRTSYPAENITLARSGYNMVIEQDIGTVLETNLVDVDTFIYQGATNYLTNTLYMSITVTPVNVSASLPELAWYDCYMATRERWITAWYDEILDGIADPRMYNDGSDDYWIQNNMRPFLSQSYRTAEYDPFGPANITIEHPLKTVKNFFTHLCTEQSAIDAWADTSEHDTNGLYEAYFAGTNTIVFPTLTLTGAYSRAGMPANWNDVDFLYGDGTGRIPPLDYPRTVTNTAVIIGSGTNVVTNTVTGFWNVETNIVGVPGSTQSWVATNSDMLPGTTIYDYSLSCYPEVMDEFVELRELCDFGGTTYVPVQYYEGAWTNCWSAAITSCTNDTPADRGDIMVYLDTDPPYSWPGIVTQGEFDSDRFGSGTNGYRAAAWVAQIDIDTLNLYTNVEPQNPDFPPVTYPLTNVVDFYGYAIAVGTWDAYDTPLAETSGVRIASITNIGDSVITYNLGTNALSPDWTWADEPDATNTTTRRGWRIEENFANDLNCIVKPQYRYRR